MTEPSAFVFICTEHDLVFARALTIITTNTVDLIAVSPRELVALSLMINVGTSLDIGLDCHHVVFVLKDGRDARFPLLELDQGAGVGAAPWRS